MKENLKAGKIAYLKNIWAVSLSSHCFLNGDFIACVNLSFSSPCSLLLDL